MVNIYYAYVDDKNILVTGSAGYIGSHVCKALQQAGYVPVTFDNLVTGWQDAVKFGPFEQCDLLNRSDIDRVFEKDAHRRSDAFCHPQSGGRKHAKTWSLLAKQCHGVAEFDPNYGGSWMY